MANSNDQSVVADSDTSTQVQGEGSNAQADDFASLLSEYSDGVNKQQTSSPAPAVKPADGGDLTLEKRMEMLERERLERQEQELLAEVRQGVDRAVDTLKPMLKDLPVKLPDKVIRGYLAETAQEDPRFMAAFENRAADPAKWDRIVAALGRKMRDEFGDPTDVAATETRAAVSAAVRASATRAPEADTKNWATMSNKEFFEAAHRLAR